MESKFKPRRSIERATRFKVLYWEVMDEEKTVHEREFNTLKSLRQWIDRNGESFDILILKTLALILDEWEPFTTIGKKTITLADLEIIVRDLREDYKPSKTEN